MESSRTQGRVHGGGTWVLVENHPVLERVPQSCRVASAPQYPAEDREPWAWKTGPAGLAGGL